MRAYVRCYAKKTIGSPNPAAEMPQRGEVNPDPPYAPVRACFAIVTVCDMHAVGVEASGRLRGYSIV